LGQLVEGLGVGEGFCVADGSAVEDIGGGQLGQLP
jgi:hypothetical protein